jgi:DNA-binding NtrC family response regulator
MSNMMSWQREPSPHCVPGSAAQFESALDAERLNALRDLVRMLLTEVEALQGAQPAQADHSAGLQNQVQRFESDLIRQALHRTRGNQAQAARLLGVKHTTLNAKIHRYGISLIDQAEEAEKTVREHVIAA